MTSTYEIEITTSDRTRETGTDATVHIMMTGENGEKTDWLKLDKCVHDDFERGSVEKYTVSCKYVGLPIIINFKLGNWIGTDEWLCDMVTITCGHLKATFPIYEWISDEAVVARGDACLPQNIASETLRNTRKKEVDGNKAKFPWVGKATDENDIGWGLPRYVKAETAHDLPKIFQRGEVREANIVKNGLMSGLNDIFQMVEALICPIDELHDYHDLYEHDKLKRQDPLYLEDWNSDESLGRQTLNGITPLCFKRCTSLPKDCVITNGDVAKTLGAGKTLESEMKAGRIYVADYFEIFKGVERIKHDKGKNTLVCPECIGLFYVNERKQFLPLAIQLVAGSRDHVFTPADKHYDWLLAKMYFRCAQSNVHEWISHFLETHGAMEPFGVALFRCLPRGHPVYKLLRPHLRTVMVINTDARGSLIAPNALASRGISTDARSLTRKVYKTFNIGDLNIPKLLKNYGTDDPNLLPNYYYRDDALAHWDAMERFVKGVIGHYYKSNEDVVNDYELQDWAQDVANEGLGWQHGDTKGMPKQLTTVDQLVDICVTLIFTSSVQHAAVNFGQFENYKYVPNSPLGMRLPPHKNGEANKQRVIDSLPDPQMAASVITVVFALSDYSPNEVYLGYYKEKLFTEKAVIDMQEAYLQELKDLEKKIKARNDKLAHPYTHLLPSRVPNSIAI